MNHRTLFTWISLIVVAVFMAGCLPKYHSDSFYNDKGGLDSLQFPLIKPYYVIYLDKEYKWQMPLLADPPSESTYYYYNLHDIQKLSVENDVIMVYTPFIEHNIDQSAGQKIYHWFVIVPESNVEEGFESESSFLLYLQKYHIERPIWSDPDSLYKKFFKTGCLSWIPDCI